MLHSVLPLLLGPAFAALSSDSQLGRNRKHLQPEASEIWSHVELSGILPWEGNVQSLRGKLCLSQHSPVLGRLWVHEGFIPAHSTPRDKGDLWRSSPTAEPPPPLQQLCLLQNNLGEGAEGSCGLLKKMNNLGELDEITEQDNSASQRG